MSNWDKEAGEPIQAYKPSHALIALVLLACLATGFLGTLAWLLSPGPAFIAAHVPMHILREAASPY